MILTRCPACGTTFRVQPEQLQARDGRVRCGQCKHAFNALDARLDEAPLSDEMSAASAAAPNFFILEERSPTTSEAHGAAEEPEIPGSTPTAAETAELPSPAVEIVDAAFEPSPAEPLPVADTARLDTFADTAAPEERPAVEIDSLDFQGNWPTAPKLDLKSPPGRPAADTPVNFDALLHKQDVGIAPHAFAVPSDGISETTGDVQSVTPTRPHTAPAGAAAPEQIASEMAQADEAADKPEPSSQALRQAAWAASAAFLSLALLAQCALVFRSDIVQSSPQMRPFMENLCAGLGCELPLPRDASEIAIESSDIQPDASREAFFTLHATLRNRAEFPQAYPHLEITLTDARDRALVRKVLEPREWLPVSAPNDAFQARREVATRVNFEAPGVAAAGYRVYAFYP